MKSQGSVIFLTATFLFFSLGARAEGTCTTEAAKSKFAESCISEIKVDRAIDAMTGISNLNTDAQIFEKCRCIARNFQVEKGVNLQNCTFEDAFVSSLLRHKNVRASCR